MEATLILYCCEQGHLHAALRLESGGTADDQIVGAAEDWPALKAICRDDHGRFAPCGGGGGSGGTGRTAAERREQQQQSLAAAKKLIDKVRDRSDKPTVKETQKLHEHLSGLTVTQLKALKADYGLKASGKNKEALVDRIKSRISEKADKEANPQVASKRPEPFKDGKEGQAWGEKAYEKWAAKLSENEKFALETYTGHDYASLNKGRKALRAGEGMTDWARDIVKNLDGALAKGKTDRDIIVHRGVSGVDVIREIRMNVGGTFSDRAYQSTSVDSALARDFGSDMVVNIHVPKGSIGAYVGGLRMENHYEREFILPRNSTYRIIGVSKDASGRHVVDARLE
jgi:hypothetical protein